LIGKIKPDAEAFQHVTEALRCEPQEVLFLDDNELNVAGARSIGMQSIRVRGIVEVERALLDFGIISVGRGGSISSV
jgi:putative hydrolase of the HAD superfamily